MANETTSWFTTYFGIDLPQYQLPFVDFRLDRDVPLYIDPYAITKDCSDMGPECSNLIVSYFQSLLDAVRVDNPSQIRKLISRRLSEPSQICLGVSTTSGGGRGIGTDQEEAIITALRNSAAAKTGAIQAMQEMELHMPLIGPDKISDLVANVILGQLAQFTERMCEQYGVPTRPCPVDGFWNAQRVEWDAGYYNLPAVGATRSLILVPRRYVRRERDLMNHREFYDKYITDTLQRELLTADDSLVQTLRSGKRRVTKKGIRGDERFTPTKEHISTFILEHPEVIDKYRAVLMEDFRPVDPAEWSGKAQEDDAEILSALDALAKIQTGRDAAHAYHATVFRLLEFVFDQYLENFEKEYVMDGGRGRIDIVADNAVTGGFFLAGRHDYDARSIPIECKNYAQDIGNNEFNQIIDRMGPKTSRLGMVVCRSVSDRKAVAQHITDRWLRQSCLILLIDDSVLEVFVRLRLARDFRGIEARLRRLERAAQYGNIS